MRQSVSSSSILALSSKAYLFLLLLLKQEYRVLLLGTFGFLRPKPNLIFKDLKVQIAIYFANFNFFHINTLHTQIFLMSWTFLQWKSS